MIHVSELIKAQVYEAAVMFICGAAFMILFEIFAFIKCKSGMKKFAAAVFELMFWAFAGILTCAFLYRGAFGAISFHTAIAFIFGVFLWKKIFYGIIYSGETVCSEEKSAEAESSERAIR